MIDHINEVLSLQFIQDALIPFSKMIAFGVFCAFCISMVIIFLGFWFKKDGVLYTISMIIAAIILVLMTIGLVIAIICVVLIPLLFCIVHLKLFMINQFSMAEFAAGLISSFICVLILAGFINHSITRIQLLEN